MKLILAYFKWILAAALILALAGCTADDEPAPTPLPGTPTPVIAPAFTASPSPSPTLVAATTPTPDIGAIIGLSVQGRPIKLYRFGDGPLKLLMVGGIHGGYEINSVALAEAMIAHYQAQPADLAGLSVLIVPDANPDAVAAYDAAGGRIVPGDRATSPGAWRTNANGVDLNRNWDCRWQPTGVWVGGPISGGSQPFSEPETVALHNLIIAEKPSAVVFWHSAMGAVLGGGCGDYSAFDASKALAKAYADGAGYHENRAEDNSTGAFTEYAISGDASNWVASQHIPALTVELSTHESPEFDQNLAGLAAIIDYIRVRPWMVRN